MELRRELAVPEAPVQVGPGGGSHKAGRAVAMGGLLLVQAGTVWIFLDMWWWHLGDVLEAPAADTLLVRALSAVLVVGILAVEVVLLARRRRDPLSVAGIATGALVFTTMLESMGSF